MPSSRPDDEDRAELQALGGVQGQQRGGIDVVLDGVLVGDQRHVFEEFIQRARSEYSRARRRSSCTFSQRSSPSSDSSSIYAL